MGYKKKTYLIFFIFTTFLLTACTQTSNNISNETSNTTSSTTTNKNQSEKPSATSLPFKEMTIPALRQRSYNSQLEGLNRLSESINFTSYLTSYQSDGLKINGLLTKPKGEQPANGWPAIVFVHGYIPPQQYITTEKYVEYVNYLARNGFVVFKIDLRGHGNSEGEAGGGYYSADYVIDTLNAYAALENADFIDSKRIGLWGHSMAGNILLRSFAAKPDIPAVVIWGGAGFTYTDLQEYRINDNSYRPQSSDSPSRRKREELTKTHGQFTADSDFWKQVNPSNYLKDLKGAIQLNHAINDDVVSVNYSRNLNKLLDDTSVIHELNEYPNGGHNISGASFNQAMENTTQFYKDHL